MTLAAPVTFDYVLGMDNGAHYHCCDFQVHTPRDINWQGQRATTEEERAQYSEEFVAACRAKGLQAVAITDHHDLVFFKYIKSAVLSETDEHGEALPPEAQLVVFPGMELTLAVPCQALLILDADYPVELLQQVVHALSVTPAPEKDSTHAPTVRLEHIKTLKELYTELNKKEFLRDRFIALPHVGDSGDFSIVRKGMSAAYKDMPCVGGYVDGSLPDKTSIVDGKAKEWGNKAVAVFQTSDNRSRDFQRLGEDVTWVKWARPTAEALRQACLARHSRVAHKEPRLPPLRITRIEVTNSKFLGPIELDVNPQYNAVIGGRGTGKSSILEYMRWALCDQPPTSTDADGEDLADFHRRRQSLIEGTLLPLDAVVDVAFLLNGVPHVVRRKASGEISMRIAEGGFEPCTEQNVRELLPVRAYSQKQLSAVGARLLELRRFVDAPIQSELEALQERADGLAVELRTAFEQVVRHRELREEIAAHEMEQRSLTEQIESLRKSLKGLPDADRVVIARQTSYESERRVVQSLERDAETAKESLASVADELARLPGSIDDKNTPENAEVIQRAREALDSWVSDAVKSIGVLRHAFAEPVATNELGPYFEAIAEWKRKQEAHEAEHEHARARAKSHEETLKQIQQLEVRLGEINNATDTKTAKTARLGDPEGKFDGLRADWIAVHVERAELLEKQSQELTDLSGGKLQATLRRSGDVEPLADRLRTLLKGTKSRAESVEKLAAQVADAEQPLEVWHEILDELLELAWMDAEDEAVTKLPAAPTLDGAGFTQKTKFAIAKQWTPRVWIDLLTFELQDMPVFEYQVRPDDFLPFEDASPGQQATVLLSILLAQDGPPLLIDQPEDDLNMKIINDIVRSIWSAKSHRQVIFASHNANLVVNGDAELIVCCDYRTSATESGGRIKLAGAIDMPEIRQEITDVMEGGKEAFTLRHQKYGF